MTADAMSSDICYSVCFLSSLLGDPEAMCFPISVSANAKIQDLALKIRDEPNLQSELDKKKLCLFKVKLLCGEVSTVPEDKVYSSVVGWLSEHVKPTQMQLVFRMEHYFPEGPAPEEKGLIDVVAVADSTLKSLFRSRTPDNQTFTIVESTPRKAKLETEDSVKKFLIGYDAMLGQYLTGPPWKDFWEAPESADNSVAEFIRNLKIPSKSGNPVLLLHNLGDTVVDSTVVNGLFSKTSRFLVNTSGSGKTRLLFEGLTMHWGFYFTTVVDALNHNLGSEDIQQAIDEYIPMSRGFIPKPGTLGAEHQHVAYKSNHLIAERRVIQVLTARILFFEHFLKIARETSPDGSVDKFKKHWLFLQLCSANLLGSDVFMDLTKELTDASDEVLLKGRLVAHAKLTKLQEEFSLDKDFFFVLDEAQVALDRLQDSFCSEQKEKVKRPVLRPIIKSWQLATEFPIIVSGTGLSIVVVNEVVTSAVMKVNAFTRATRTGAFDDENRQREYILRYMPPGLAGTESGKAFLRRAWNYARGRHRFTSVLLTQLLKFSFQSPHRILNAFVEASCGLVPTDAQHFIDEEQTVPYLEESIGAIQLFDFSKITNSYSRLRLFSDILYAWLMLRERIKLIEEHKDLVELGFARFTDPGGKDAYVDEPIVLLAAARQFDTAGVPLDRHTWRTMDSATRGENKGHSYEKSIAYYLACAFDDQTNLCEIFNFGKDVPKWAERPAELISVVLTDEGPAEANRFHLPDYLGSTSAIGVNCPDSKKTMQWLENPTSVMCFPDNNMGPDIICFIRLLDGTIVAVLVQCKFRDKNTLDPGTLDAAVKSLDVSQLYQRSTLTTHNATAARECAIRLFNRLNKPDFRFDSEGWCQDGVPVLKVIASIANSNPPPFHAMLKRDRYDKMMEESRMQERLALSFGSKRALESDFASASRKRPRT
ncbi:hypothetical protein ACEPAI_3172 [Sanghuangporus weigelae]